MAKYKNQHYLAQSYLKFFSPGCMHGDPVVWVGDMESRTIKIRSIKKTATRSYMYSYTFPDGTHDHWIEHLFGRIERLYPDTVGRVLSTVENLKLGKEELRLLPWDYHYLCVYVFIYLCRSPKTVDWITQASTQQKNGDDSDDEVFLESDPSNRAVLELYNALRHRREAMRFLASKGGRILYTVRRSSSILTCDNPVVRFQDAFEAPIMDDKTMIVFPISSRVCMTLIGIGTGYAFANMPDPSQVEVFNKLIAANAYKEIYGSSEKTILKALDDPDSWTVIKSPQKIDPLEK